MTETLVVDTLLLWVGLPKLVLRGHYSLATKQLARMLENMEKLASVVSQDQEEA